MYIRYTELQWVQWVIVFNFHVSFLKLCVTTQGNFLAISSLLDCWGLLDPFLVLKMLNGCWNIQSLQHKKSTCLCLMLCNFVTSIDFVKSIHHAVPQAVSLDQYYSQLTFYFMHRLRKVMGKMSQKRSTCCSNLCAGLRCYMH